MSKDTKERILSCAAELFAQKGYAGASIRDISKLSDVNIAAVSYHFESKEKLFLEVIAHNYKFLDKEVKQVCDNAISIEDCVVKIFRLFIKHGDKILNTFKFLMNENISFDKSVFHSSKGSFGPPGNDTFMEYIMSEYEKMSHDDAFYVMKNVFGIICHSALIISCPVLKATLNSSSKFSEKQQENNLVKLTSSLISSTV